MTEQVELLNIPVSDISFGNRARQNYKNLDILAEDFRTKGIIQPIAVKKTEDEDKPFLLLAGGRRYSAAVLGDFSTIPARVYNDDLSELDYREIELMENVSRENLDWKEKAWLEEEIDNLMKEKHGVAGPGPGDGHSQADTAKMLGKSAQSITRSKQLAEGLRKHGAELDGAKNEAEALRMLKRIKRKKEEKVVATRLEDDLAKDRGDAIKRALTNSYILNDFFEGIKDVPSSAVHFVEIDPPYAINLKKIKYGRRDDLETYEEVEEKNYPEFLEKLFAECYRVMFPESWLVCWHAIQWYPTIKTLLVEAGFSAEKIPAIWNKGIVGQTHNPEQRLGSSYEPFIYARKGKPVIRKPGRGNVWDYKPIHSEHKVHPTERPIEMIQDVIETFCPPGGHLCVPFLGSGNTLLAAANLGMSCFGFDLSEEYKNSYLAKVEAGRPKEYNSYR